LLPRPVATLQGTYSLRTASLYEEAVLFKRA